MDRKNIILYYTHYLSPSVEAEIGRIREELAGDYEMAIVGASESPDMPRQFQGISVYCYGGDDLAQLSYPHKLKNFRWDGFSQDVDLVPLRFFREHHEYDYYWIIEHDVRFSGSWTTIFSDLSSSPAHLLCTTLQRWEDNPRWSYWSTLSPGNLDVARSRLVKGFMPFCRLSRELLNTIDTAYRGGWAGHFEVVWPTSAMLHDLLVEDIGGYGRFTPFARRGRYYINSPEHWSLFPGTFVYRPRFSTSNRFGADDPWQDLLWHPVRAP